MERRRLVAVVAPLVIAFHSTAEAASREVIYDATPRWALSPPSAVDDPPASDAAFRIIYQDLEERITPGKQETYTAYRVKILKPEALPLGNVAVLWSPSGGSAQVHYVRIIRDKQSIDVLKLAKFKVLERETGLEQSVLDGNLTATLQVPGLQVGDELEFAGTTTRSEPAFGDHAAGAAQLPFEGLPGTFRYRLLWPENKPLSVRLSKDLPTTAPKSENGYRVLDLELRDPAAIPQVEGAPPRFNVHRAIEYSDYGTWADLSKRLWPLFASASHLEANSPIRVEAAKIATSSQDAAERAQAALRLVQEQVRYVFVGLDGGNYVPATADETWQRRFGDCKAKTVLLLALLRELGVTAEPVLVNSKGGDGTNERMPNPGNFDHVLVRATVNGKTLWLDGTRLGDHHLDMLPPAQFEWALPLSAPGSNLVAVPPATSPYPQSITIVDIDATGGFAKDAKWTVEQVLRGDQALQIQSALTSVSPAESDRLLKTYWQQQDDFIEPDEVSWHYDDRHAALLLSLKGDGKVDWEGDSSQGHSFTLPGAGFYPPEKRHRLKDQDQSAAWSVEYPRFRCNVTTMHLPSPTPKFSWTYSAKPMDRHLGGVAYWRAAGIRGNLVRTVMSRQSYVREISAAEAQDVNAAIPTFDNNMSTVEETQSPATGLSTTLPFTAEPDWTANASVCSPPAK